MHHIAEIRGAGALPGRRDPRRTSQPRVLDQEIVQRQVWHLVGQGQFLRDLAGHPGHQRRPPHNIPEPLRHLVQIISGEGAQGKASHRLGGDHIFRPRKGFHRIMHTHVVPDVLPQKFHSLEGQQQRVECASALLRHDGRVGLFPVECHVKGGQRQTADVRAGVRPAVHHQRHVDVFQITGLHHIDLSAEGLLGGGAVNHQCKRLIPAAVFQRHRRAQAGRSLHMMPAPMPQPGQSVVLAEEADAGGQVAGVCGRASGRLSQAGGGLSRAGGRLSQAGGGLSHPAAPLRPASYAVVHGPKGAFQPCNRALYRESVLRQIPA